MTKSKFNIFISDEGKNDSKYVIKGNELTYRWIDRSIIVWSTDDGEPDIIKLLSRMENERSRMANLLFKNGINQW